MAWNHITYYYKIRRSCMVVETNLSFNQKMLLYIHRSFQITLKFALGRRGVAR